MTTESLAQHIANRLISNTEPAHTVLAIFFCSAFNVSLVPDITKMFNKLVRMYGKDSVYNAILDAYDMATISSTDKPQKMYALLSYFIKNSMSKTQKHSASIIDIINENKLRQQNLASTKIIIPNPFVGERNID